MTALVDCVVDGSCALYFWPAVMSSPPLENGGGGTDAKAWAVQLAKQRELLLIPYKVAKG